MAAPGTIRFAEVASNPPTPSAGYASVFIKTDNVFYIIDSSGVVTPLGSASSITSLTGDVTGAGPGAAATTVQFVGGQAASNIAAATVEVESATSSNVNSTLVQRDISGNFSANVITASLNGNAATSTSSVSAIDFTGTLNGDVTGTQGSTVVSFVGGESAAAVAASVAATGAATPSNMANTLVERDASGNFAAGIITAALNGNASTATSAGSATTAVNFTGSLSGDVTGTQGATAITSSVVTGKLLTGYLIGANTPISATDSILSAFEKIQGQLSATMSSAITGLTGDVSAAGPGNVPATVNSVGGQSAASVATAAVAVAAATPSNTASTLVERDSSGNFTAGTITAALTGAASANVLKAGDTMTGQLILAAAGVALAVSNNATIGGTLVVTSTIAASNFTGSSSGSNTGDVSTANTNSIDLAFSSGQLGLNASLNLSAASADATYIPILVEIKSDGLFAEGLAGTPVQIGTSNNVGSAAAFSRADHVHQITSSIVLGLLLTGYASGSNTPINATDTLLQAFENLQAQISAGASSAITSLTGDVSATGPGASAATVNSVGGQSAAAVAAAAVAVAAATNLDTPSTLVERDSSGNFSAGTITAALIGNVTGNVSGSAASFTGSLSGDVTGTQGATKVVAIQNKTVSNVAPTDAQFLIYSNGAAQYNPESMSGDVSMTNAGVTTVATVGGSSAASVHAAAVAVAAATNLDTPSTLVERDASGNFSAGTITASLNGNASTSTSFTGSLAGDVTGTQGATLVSKIQGTAVAGTTGSGNVAFSASPTFTGTISGSALSLSGQLSSTDSSTTAVVFNTTSFIFDTLNNAFGIGTQPATTVMIDGINTSGASKLVQMTGYGIGSTTGYRGRFARGTVGSPTAAQTGDILSAISGRGYGASQFAAASTGVINIVAGENFTNTSNMTYLQFNATPTGSVTSVEHMRVSGTGVTLGAPSASTDIHQINGGLYRTNKTITGSYTVDTTTSDDIIYCNQSAAITITLPSPTSGRTIVVKDTSGNAQTNTITIAPHASEKIESLTASKVLYTNFGSWTFSSDGTNWWMV